MITKNKISKLILITGLILFILMLVSCKFGKKTNYKIMFEEDYGYLYRNIDIGEEVTIAANLIDDENNEIHKIINYEISDKSIIMVTNNTLNTIDIKLLKYGKVTITASVLDIDVIPTVLEINFEHSSITNPKVEITDEGFFTEKIYLGDNLYFEDFPILINNNTDFSNYLFDISEGHDVLIIKTDYNNNKYLEIDGVGKGEIIIKSIITDKVIATVEVFAQFHAKELYDILGLSKNKSYTKADLSNIKTIKIDNTTLTDWSDFKYLTSVEVIESNNSYLNNIELVDLPYLERITISKNDYKSTKIKMKIEGSPSLRFLEISNMRLDELVMTNERDSSDFDVSLLPHSLQSLTVVGYVFRDINLSNYSKLTNLHIENNSKLIEITLPVGSNNLNLSLINNPYLIDVNNLDNKEIEVLVLDKVDRYFLNMIDENSYFAIDNVKTLKISNVMESIGGAIFKSQFIDKIELSNFSGSSNFIKFETENLSKLTIKNIDLLKVDVPESVKELSVTNTKVQQLYINGNKNLAIDLLDNTSLSIISMTNIRKLMINSFNNNFFIKEFIIKNSEVEGYSKIDKFSDKLDKFYLSNTNIDQIDPDLFKYATNVDLSGNGIKSIDSFSKNTNLTHLDISNNLLTSTTSFTGLNRLTDLYLGNNQLEDINLSNMFSLKNLGLENNLFYANESYNYGSIISLARNLETLSVYTTNQISNRAISKYYHFIDELEQILSLKVISLEDVTVAFYFDYSQKYDTSSLYFSVNGNKLAFNDYEIIPSDNTSQILDIKDDSFYAYGIGSTVLNLINKLDDSIQFRVTVVSRFKEDALNNYFIKNGNEFQSQSDLANITSLHFNNFNKIDSLEELKYFGNVKELTFTNSEVPNENLGVIKTLESIKVTNNVGNKMNFVIEGNASLTNVDLKDATFTNILIDLENQTLDTLLIPSPKDKLVLKNFKFNKLDLSDQTSKNIILDNIELDTIIFSSVGKYESISLSNLKIFSQSNNLTKNTIDSLYINNTDLNILELISSNDTFIGKNINNLTISNNDINYLDFTGNIFKNLTLINLSASQLILSDKIRSLTLDNISDISELNFISTTLEKLFLKNMGRLVSLSATQNKYLKEIDFDGDFTYLTDIDLSYNDLVLIPVGLVFDNIPKLESLNLVGNININTDNILNLQTFEYIFDIKIGNDKNIDISSFKDLVALMEYFDEGVVKITIPEFITEVLVLEEDVSYGKIEIDKYTNYLIITTNDISKIVKIYGYIDYEGMTDLTIELDGIELISITDNYTISSNNDVVVTLKGRESILNKTTATKNNATINVVNLVIDMNLTVYGAHSITESVSGGTAISASNITFASGKVVVIGGNGSDGRDGLAGDDGLNGTSKEANGTSGKEGRHGGSGTNGGAALSISESITVLKGAIVSATGGNGGNAGNGGAGGKGGNGYNRPPQNLFQKGGNAGNGGKGGNAGSVGEAGKAMSNVTNDQIRDVLDGTEGIPAFGGKGGKAGDPGKATFGSGKNGSDGANGTPLPIE